MRVRHGNGKSWCYLIEDIPRYFSLISCVQFISSFALTFCSFSLAPKFFLLILKGHITEAEFSICYFLDACSFWFFHLSACLHKTIACKTSLTRSAFLASLVGSGNNTVFGWRQLSCKLSESIKEYKDLKVFEIRGVMMVILQYLPNLKLFGSRNE